MDDSTNIDDLLGITKHTARKMTYQTLVPPPAKDQVEGGIWELRAAAKKAGTLGKKCLICKEGLIHRGGRPPTLCEKKKCFRAYRNAYRADYDKARGDRG